MVQWNEGDYPAQIWGFVNLQGLPLGRSVKVDENSVVMRGIYAIVESSLYVEEEEPWSDIFSLLQVDTKALNKDGSVKERKFYMVDVETFKDPIVVIPNVGTKAGYLFMKPRAEWSDDFIEWIEMPHTHDKIEMLPPPEEADTEEEEEEEE
jgi:hypothetical protein